MLSRLVARVRSAWPLRDRTRRCRRGDRVPPVRGSRRAARRRAPGAGGPRRGAPRLRQRDGGPRGHARGVGLGPDRTGRPGRPLRPAGADRRAHRLDRRHPDADAGDRRQHRDLLDRQRPAAPAAAGRGAGAAGAARTDGAGERLHWTNPIWEQLRDHAAVRRRLRLGRPALQPGRRPARAITSPGCGRAAACSRCSASRPSSGARSPPRTIGGRSGPTGPVAVLGYDFWQRRFGGSPAAIGRRITVERVPFTIVGVAPPVVLRRRGRAHVRRGHPDRGVDARSAAPSSSIAGRSWWLRVMFRLKPGQTPEAAKAQLARPDAGHPPGDAAAGLVARPPPARGARGRRGTDRRVVAAPRLRAAAGDPHGRRLRRPADRVRQPRQPPARARRGATAGAEPARRARRLALAASRASCCSRAC